MSVMQTLKKRVKDPIHKFKRTPDELVFSTKLDAVNSLFSEESG